MTISIKSAEVFPRKINAIRLLLTEKRQADCCVVKLIRYLVRHFNRIIPSSAYWPNVRPVLLSDMSKVPFKPVRSFERFK